MAYSGLLVGLFELLISVICIFYILVSAQVYLSLGRMNQCVNVLVCEPIEASFER